MLGEHGTWMRLYASLTAGLARLPTTVLAVPLAGAYLLHILSQPHHWLDDAFIFFRYAANWADGHGPVFNLGERVEGYSSVLWTMILAAGAALSIEPERFAPVMATGLAW
jgi:arabinofuranosyltransferase